MCPLEQLAPTKTDGSFKSQVKIPSRTLDDGKQIPMIPDDSGIEIRLPGTDILKMGGMSSQKTRHFLNNLCSIEDWPINYLEIGVWRGSTFISSGFMNSNNINQMVAIDNFTQFNENSEVKEAFLDNSHRWLKHKFELHDEDCFKIEKSKLRAPFNVYFYDGPHSYEDTKMSLTHYDDVLDNIFILVVDDWQEKPIQDGLKDAIKELNYKVHYEISLHGKGGNISKEKIDSVPYYEQWRDEFWQGQYVDILEKQNQ